MQAVKLINNPAQTAVALAPRYTTCRRSHCGVPLRTGIESQPWLILTVSTRCLTVAGVVMVGELMQA
jgi:hypothetical protein